MYRHSTAIHIVALLIAYATPSFLRNWRACRSHNTTAAPVHTHTHRFFASFALVESIGVENSAKRNEKGTTERKSLRRSIQSYAYSVFGFDDFGLAAYVVCVCVRVCRSIFYLSIYIYEHEHIIIFLACHYYYDYYCYYLTDKMPRDKQKYLKRKMRCFDFIFLSSCVFSISRLLSLSRFLYPSIYLSNALLPFQLCFGRPVA